LDPLVLLVTPDNVDLLVLQLILELLVLQELQEERVIRVLQDLRVFLELQLIREQLVSLARKVTLEGLEPQEKVTQVGQVLLELRE
jgi:hypothetical protein